MAGAISSDHNNALGIYLSKCTHSSHVSRTVSQDIIFHPGLSEQETQLTYVGQLLKEKAG